MFSSTFISSDHKLYQIKAKSQVYQSGDTAQVQHNLLQPSLWRKEWRIKFRLRLEQQTGALPLRLVASLDSWAKRLKLLTCWFENSLKTNCTLCTCVRATVCNKCSVHVCVWTECECMQVFSNAVLLQRKLRSLVVQYQTLSPFLSFTSSTNPLMSLSVRTN